MKNDRNFSKLIETLTEVEGVIKDQTLSDIERDLLLEKLRVMYSSILSTTFTNLEKQVITIPEPVVLPSVTNTVIDPVKNEEIIIPVKEEKNITQESIKLPAADEIVVKEEPIEAPAEEIKPVFHEPVVIKVTEPVKPVVAETQKVNEKKEGITLSDKLGENKSTLGEVLNNIRSQNDLVTKLHKSPVTSLKNAISINDRIMFSKELFGGNSDLFHNTIEELNKQKNLDEALDILTGKIEMDDQNPALEKFMQIIYRRFLASDGTLK